MLIRSIVLGLIGVFCILDSRLLGRLNFERPLIVSTLVGLALGDLEKGLIVGASLELMSLGLCFRTNARDSHANDFIEFDTRGRQIY